MDNPLLLTFVKVTIFTLMLALGVNLSVPQLLSLWRRPGLLLRSLLAVIVLVPLVVVLLLWVFGLPTAVATGLAVLAAAPGAPLMTKRSQMAGGNVPYAASLQLTLALLAVVVTPLTLAVLHALFELATERVTAFEVARQVAVVQFVPVIVGLLLQHVGPKLADGIGKPLIVLANVLFLALVALVLIPGVRLTLTMGGLTIVAMVIVVGVSLAIGHLLGGPTRDERSVLAIASIARNIGLALFITALSGAEQQVIPTIVAYAILAAILAIPYSLWRKRHMVAVA